MNSFVIKTICGEMIVTFIKVGSNKIKIFLNGIIDNIKHVQFYEDGADACEIDYNTIMERMKRLVNYHFLWDEENKIEFEKWLFKFIEKKI